MYIRDRLRVSLMVALITITALLPLISWSLVNLQSANQRSELSTKLQKAILERIFLRDEFLLLANSAEDARQWQDKNQELAHIIDQLEEAVSEKDQIEDFGYLKTKFSRHIENFGKNLGNAAD